MVYSGVCRVCSHRNFLGETATILNRNYLLWVSTLAYSRDKERLEFLHFTEKFSYDTEGF